VRETYGRAIDSFVDFFRNFETIELYFIPLDVIRYLFIPHKNEISERGASFRKLEKAPK